MTARRDVRVYLRDMLDAIERIRVYTAEGKEAFLADEKTQDAVIRQLSILGESARRVPPGFRSKHPELPWRNIVGMRNILIHEYSDTSIRRVWDTVRRSLPSLRKAIEALLKKEAA